MINHLGNLQKLVKNSSSFNQSGKKNIIPIAAGRVTFRKAPTKKLLMNEFPGVPFMD